jgi:hypothetical protein
MTSQAWNYKNDGVLIFLGFTWFLLIILIDSEELMLLMPFSLLNVTFLWAK